MINDSHLTYQTSLPSPDSTNPLLSFFHGSFDPTPTATLTLAQVLSKIASDIYEPQITKLRNALRNQGRGTYDFFKKLLDAVTFGGTFHPSRAKAHLIQHSGLVHLDFDGVPDVAGVKQVLCVGVGVSYCFLSPSAHGLKLGVRVEPVADDTQYKRAWQAVADHFERQYELIADPTGKDISRLCYVSWDPDAFFNPQPTLFHVPTLRQTGRNTEHMLTPPPPAPVTRASTPATGRRAYYLQQAINNAIALIESSRPQTRDRPGTRHLHRLRAANLLGGYIGGGFLTYDEAYAILEPVVRRNTLHFARSMRTIADGLRHGMQHPVTFEQLEQERLAWCAAHGYTQAQRESR
jgi:hypothetical protein